MNNKSENMICSQNRLILYLAHADFLFARVELIGAAENIWFINLFYFKRYPDYENGC